MLIPPILSFLLNFFFFNYIIQLLLKSLHWKVPLLRHLKQKKSWYCISNPVLLEPPGECTHHFHFGGRPFKFSGHGLAVYNILQLCIRLILLPWQNDNQFSGFKEYRFVMLQFCKSVTQYWFHWAKIKMLPGKLQGVFHFLFLLVLAKFASLRLKY